MHLPRRAALACLPLLALAVLAAGCGSGGSAAPAAAPARPRAAAAPRKAVAPRVRAPRCTAGALVRLGSALRAYVGDAPRGAVARRSPGGAVVARFGSKNVNDYPTVFGVVGKVVGSSCAARWYRVELPLRPNGAAGYVRASALRLRVVSTRIVVSISGRRLTFYSGGVRKLVATVAVGAPDTPTPTGRYYVNQRLVPTDPSGPYGPGALGISAYSPVLVDWPQGGPVAIHGTNEPWSIGHDVSNGCIRLPNATLQKLFAEVPAGTPVIIRA